MKKRTILIILGLWVTVLPFLGFPIDWQTWILFVSGLAVAIISFFNAKNTTSLE